MAERYFSGYEVEIQSIEELEHRVEEVHALGAHPSSPTSFRPNVWLPRVPPKDRSRRADCNLNDFGVELRGIERLTSSMRWTSWGVRCCASCDTVGLFGCTR